MDAKAAKLRQRFKQTSRGIERSQRVRKLKHRITAAVPYLLVAASIIAGALIALLVPSD